MIADWMTDTQSSGFDLKEELDAWRTVPYPSASMYYPYEGYGFPNG